MKKHLYINIYFDESDDYAGRRIINISFAIYNRPTFYWTNIDSGSIEHTATNIAAKVTNIIIDLVSRIIGKINNFTIDTYNATRKATIDFTANARFNHSFAVLYDSHSLQLLIKDLLNIPIFK